MAVDIDNDGDQDLGIAGQDSVAPLILRNRGDGTFHSPDLAGSGDFGSVSVTLTAADMDDDGDADLVVAHSGADKNERLVIWRNEIPLAPSESPSIPTRKWW